MNTNIKKLLGRLLETKSEKLKLGVDVHARDVMVAIQEEDARPLRPQKMSREQLLALVRGLVAAGRKARLLKDHGLEEATSTRALVYAANMMSAGLDPVTACQVAMVNPLTDDIELSEAMLEIIKAHFPA